MNPNPSIKNPKAFQDYEILETFEVGIELKGSEVKSIRQAQASLKESFARIEDGNVYLYKMHIAPYFQASVFNSDPDRKRRLLLHKNEIYKLVGKINQRGYTLVPVKLYFKGSLAKIELALATGKRLYDRRKELKKKELDLGLKRIMRQKNRG
jgi:SsrA-binding protein